MEKLNVCYLTQQYGNYASGLGTYSTNLINSMAELAHNVTVVCPKEKRREFIVKGINLMEVDRRRWDPSHGNWFTFSWEFSDVLKKLEKRNKSGFDIIHFTDARECFFWSLWCKSKRSALCAAVIGTMHDDTFMDAGDIFHYRKFYNDWARRYLYCRFVNLSETACLRKLDFVISVSKYVGEKLKKVYRINKNKTSVIYNGIDAYDEKYKQAPCKKERFILIVGNNFQRKGIALLFKALVELQSGYPDLKILAVGQDINRKYLENLARKMNIEDKVKFAGRKSNSYVLKKMRRALIYVMPSIKEGFGIVFLEAMACGTPVIGSITGGTKELIKNGENGFLVNPEDCRDLSNKISVLLNNSIVREKFIKNGLKTVKKFSIEKMTSETLEIYLKMLNTQPVYL